MFNPTLCESGANPHGIGNNMPRLIVKTKGPIFLKYMFVLQIVVISN